VVMRVDVAFGLNAGVAVEPVQQPRGEPPRPFGPAGIAESGAIGREDREQADRIRTRPFAGFPGLVPAGGAARGEAKQGAPVANVDFGLDPRKPPAELADGAVGKMAANRASFQPTIDPVEQLVEPGTQQARKDARLRAEAPP